MGKTEMKIHDQQRYDLELRIICVLDNLNKVTRGDLPFSTARFQMINEFNQQLQELAKQWTPLDKAGDEMISNAIKEPVIRDWKWVENV